MTKIVTFSLSIYFELYNITDVGIPKYGTLNLPSTETNKEMGQAIKILKTEV